MAFVNEFNKVFNSNPSSTLWGALIFNAAERFFPAQGKQGRRLACGFKALMAHITPPRVDRSNKKGQTFECTLTIKNVSSTNSEQSKLCINSPLQIDARLLWEQAIGSNGT